MVNTFHLTLDVSDLVVQGRGIELQPGELAVGVSHNPDVTLDDVRHDYEGIGEAAFVLRPSVWQLSL